MPRHIIPLPAHTFAVLLVWMIFLPAASRAQEATPEVPEVQSSPSLPVTIAVATIRGVDEDALMDGVELALEGWRDRNDKPFEARAEWVRLPPGASHDAINGVIEKSKPSAIIARANTASASSLGQACAASEIPCVILASFAAQGSASNYAFQLWPSLAAGKSLLIRALKTSGAKRMALLSFEEQSSPLDLDAFKEALRREGGPNLVGAQNLEPNGNLPGGFASLLSGKPDAFVIDIPTPLVAPTVTELRARNFRGLIFSSSILSERDIKGAGGALQDVRFLGFSPALGSVKSVIVQKFGELPPDADLIRAGHDAVDLVLEALADIGVEGSGEELRDYLRYRKRFDGLLGAFSFLPEGRAALTMALYRATPSGAEQLR